MIKKLPENKDKVFKTETGEYLTIPELGIPKPVSDKINELVDTVNKLQDDTKKLKVGRDTCFGRIDTLNRVINNIKKQTKKSEPADPYAEQRKWIGKLCQFWDFAYEHDYFDTLKGITDDGLFIGHNGAWQHCEPVKPDDDIIYKGGENDTITDAVNEIIDFLDKQIKDTYKVLPKSMRSMEKEFAEDECKRLQQELTKTKQALDVAVDALIYANKCIKGGCVNWETEIDRALDQIKQITETKGLKQC